MIAQKFYDNLTQAQEDRDMRGKPKYTLMAALHRSFGMEYYALGVMKVSHYLKFVSQKL